MNVELIVSTTGLPAEGMDLAPLLKEDQEVAITKQMKKKYNVQRSKKGFLIHSIIKPTAFFSSNVLESKLLRKMCPNQCTTRAIVFAKIYVARVHIN